MKNREKQVIRAIRGGVIRDSLQDSHRSFQGVFAGFLQGFQALSKESRHSQGILTGFGVEGFGVCSLKVFGFA